MTLRRQHTLVSSVSKLCRATDPKVMAYSSLAACTCRLCHLSVHPLPHYGGCSEVIVPMKTITAEATANGMRNVGLPAQIVNDNGPPFLSAEYKEFLRQNCIGLSVSSILKRYGRAIGANFFFALSRVLNI